MSRLFFGASDDPSDPQDTSVPVPLTPRGALAATLWIVAVVLAFLYGIARRLFWHLFG